MVESITLPETSESITNLTPSQLIEELELKIRLSSKFPKLTLIGEEIKILKKELFFRLNSKKNNK